MVCAVDGWVCGECGVWMDEGYVWLDEAYVWVDGVASTLGHLRLTWWRSCHMTGKKLPP